MCYLLCHNFGGMVLGVNCAVLTSSNNEATENDPERSDGTAV